MEEEIIFEWYFWIDLYENNKVFWTLYQKWNKYFLKLNWDLDKNNFFNVLTNNYDKIEKLNWEWMFWQRIILFDLLLKI